MDIQLLRRELDALELSCPVGRVSGVKGSVVEVAGLAVRNWRERSCELAQPQSICCRTPQRTGSRCTIR